MQDRWIDGWMDGCVDGWMDGWMGRYNISLELRNRVIT